MMLQPAGPPPGDGSDVITRKAIAGADWKLGVVLPAWDAEAAVREVGHEPSLARGTVTNLLTGPHRVQHRATSGP
jgi:hypothetical protein